MVSLQMMRRSQLHYPKPRKARNLLLSTSELNLGPFVLIRLLLESRLAAYGIWLAYWLGHNQNLPFCLPCFTTDGRTFESSRNQLQASIEIISEDQTSLDSMGFRTALTLT